MKLEEFCILVPLLMVISDLISVKDVPSYENTCIPDRFINTNFLYSSLKKHKVLHLKNSVCISCSDITELPSNVEFSI